MKVALVNTYAHGGAGTAAIRTAEALASIGHDARLLVREGKRSKFVQVVENQRLAKIPFLAERLAFLPFEKDWSVRFAFSPANFGLDLSRHPLIKTADAIHLHWINQGFLGLKNIAQLAALGKPLVWTLHDMWAFTGGCHYSRGCENFQTGCGDCPFLKWPSKGDLSRRVLKKKHMLFSDKIKFTTPSEWLARIARTSSLMKDADIRVIPNPIDTGFFRPFSDEERLAERQRLDIAPGRAVLLFVAMNVAEERKGYSFLKTALEKIRSQRPEFQADMLVLGKCDAAVLAELPFPARPLGLVKEAAEMRRFYALADCFIIPTLEDNLPNTVMESLSCGTPVVGFKTGGIPEMVGHLESGFLAEQRNAEELAAGILYLFEEKGRLEKVRDVARRKAVNSYGHETVARLYERLYF